jgi:hypothetical protein
MRDPRVSFYTSDFLTGTMTMSDEQTGKYIRLLCLQHQKNGYLTEKDMIKICQTYDEDIFKKFIKGYDGRYYNERMLLEINKSLKYSESRQNNRKNKSKDMSNICLSHDEHMGNENENENGNKNRNGNDNNISSFDTIFSSWWLTYPKKEEQEVTKKIFITILQNKIATPYQLTSGVSSYNAYCLVTYPEDYPHSQYIKKPKNWLNDKNWLEDWKKKITDRVKAKTAGICTDEDLEKGVFSLLGKLEK